MELAVQGAELSTQMHQNDEMKDILLLALYKLSCMISITIILKQVLEC